MRATVLLSGLLTAIATTAFPSADARAVSDRALDDAHGEIELFKRDAILTARDVELADLHGVNLTESKTEVTLSMHRLSALILFSL